MKRLACLSVVLLLVSAAALNAEDKEKKNTKPKQNAKPKAVQGKIRLKALQGRPVRFPIVRYYGSNKTYLLRRPDVQKEIKLDGDQKTEITEAIQELQKSRTAAYQKLRGLKGQERVKELQKIQAKFRADEDKKLKELLKPEQVKRLDEIALQLQGIRAFQNPEVQKKLKITDAQKKKFSEVQQKGIEKRRQLSQDIRNGNVQRAKAGEKYQEIQNQIEKDTKDVLTKEQKAQFDKMAGKKFEIQRPNFRAIQPGIRINGKKIKIKVKGIPIRGKAIPIRKKAIPKPAEKKEDK